MSALMLLKDKYQTFASYLSPYTIFCASSKYNQDIQVVKNYGRNELWVNGIRQSGGHIAGLWQQTFDTIAKTDIGKPRTFLVFGVGGGNVMQLIRNRFPAAVIDAVDIDAEIIRIGRHYFGLDDIGIRKFYCEDAAEFKTSQQYDFIVIDLYIGEHVPDFVITRAFCKKISGLLLSGGYVLINYFDDTQTHSERQLESILSLFFPHIRKIPVYENLMFLAKK
jgi:spermidine synthase